jgi:ATP-binding cassette subfamily F protein uup
MDRVSNHLLIFDGKGNIDLFSGSYTEYLNQQKTDSKQKPTLLQPSAVPEPTPPPATSDKPPGKKLSFKEEKELKTLEKEIENLEKEKAKIQEDLITFHSDFKKVETLSAKLLETDAIIEVKFKRWEELGE